MCVRMRLFENIEDNGFMKKFMKTILRLFMAFELSIFRNKCKKVKNLN